MFAISAFERLCIAAPNGWTRLAVTAENVTAARGRVVDADLPLKVARDLSRAQILQQAGTAMVAQANQLPQQVLQLVER